jgi:hypothetical protein
MSVSIKTRFGQYPNLTSLRLCQQLIVQKGSELIVRSAKLRTLGNGEQEGNNNCERKSGGHDVVLRVS